MRVKRALTYMTSLFFVLNLASLCFSAPVVSMFFEVTQVASELICGTALIVATAILLRRGADRFLIFVILSYAINVILVFARFFKVEGMKDALKDGTSHDALAATYLSIATWTSVGFGDVIPGTVACRVGAMAEALIAYVANGLLIAVLVASFTNTRSRFREGHLPEVAFTRSPTEGERVNEGERLGERGFPSMGLRIVHLGKLLWNWPENGCSPLAPNLEPGRTPLDQRPTIASRIARSVRRTGPALAVCATPMDTSLRARSGLKPARSPTA